MQTRSQVATRPVPEPKREDEDDPDDPNLMRPMSRYNAMLAVLRNTLYMYVLSLPSFVRALTLWKLSSYGGIFELGTREYTLDDFYAFQLDKLERFVCLEPSGIVIPTEAEESRDEEGVSGDEGSDDDEDGDDEDSQGETEPEDGGEKKWKKRTRGRRKKARDGNRGRAKRSQDGPIWTRRRKQKQKEQRLGSRYVVGLTHSR